MAPTIPVDGLRSVGIVVESLEDATAQFADLLGITEWDVLELDGERLRDVTVRGRRVQHSYRTARGTTPGGVLTVELVEPGDGESTYKQFLLTHRRGVHDVEIHCADPQALPALESAFAQAGAPLVQSASIDGVVEQRIFDARARLGGYHLRVVASREPGHDGRASDAQRWTLPGPTDAAEPPVTVPEVNHLGVVVRDVVDRVEAYAPFFGIDSWRFMNWRPDPSRLIEPTFDGRVVDHAYFCAMAAGFRGFGFEIIQPTFGPSDYNRNFLDVVGEGVHHLCIAFMSSDDEWERCRERMLDRGVGVIQSADLVHGMAAFYYLDTRSRLGFTTEAVCRRPGADPSRIVPEYVADFSAA